MAQPTGGGEPSETGSSGGAPAFDPCASSETIMIGEFGGATLIDILADEHGWRPVFRAESPDPNVPSGLYFVRPGIDSVTLTQVTDQHTAVLPTKDGMLVCWDNGGWSMTNMVGFCMATDELLQPTTDILEVPYRGVERLIEFPDARYALAGGGVGSPGGLWPIDAHGVPTGEPLELDVWPLALGDDWFLGERFVDPTCPMPEDDALCALEFAPFGPHGEQLAPFLPLADTTLAPNEWFTAAISGDRYLLAWTKGGPWDLRVVTQESEVVHADAVDPAEFGVPTVFGVPHGFLRGAQFEEDASGQPFGLRALDPDGKAVSPPFVIGTLDPEDTSVDLRIGAFGGGLAAAWVNRGGLLDERREQVFFRALGCGWPPAP
jgi:hypothetical protein